MARNIEIKSSIEDLRSCVDRARALSGSAPVVIEQEDYFFNCESGRLKLRVFSSEKGELIFYRRKNESGPKMSEYFISGTSEPDSLLRVLEKSHGLRGVVKKTRRLFLAGRSRIHIDRVENLGDFLEFEVVLSDEADPGDAEQEALRLMGHFGIEEDSLIPCAYIDLIERRNLQQGDSALENRN